MFNPREVERHDPGKYGKHSYVRSEDYDKLLALYLAAMDDLAAEYGHPNDPQTP